MYIFTLTARENNYKIKQLLKHNLCCQCCFLFVSPLCYEHNSCTQFAQQLKPSKGPTTIRHEDAPIHKRVLSRCWT